MARRAAPTLETARLRLRAHAASDFDAIYEMNVDPAVMHHISGPLPREDSWRRMLCGPGLWALLGYGYWAVERRDDGSVIGQVGLADFKRDMTPRIEGLPELGYVFGSHAHGRGFAREAVEAVLAWADETFAPEEIVAIIDADNVPSIRVAEHFGFAHRETASYRGKPVELLRRYRLR